MSERWISLATLVALLVLVVGVGFGTPGQSFWLPECPFHALTGLYCTGCGSTRMLYYLMHGHPVLAARENVLALVLLPVLALTTLRRVMFPAWGQAHRRARPAWGFALSVIVLGFTVLRNLPIKAGCALAPGQVCAFSRGAQPLAKNFQVSSRSGAVPTLKP